MSNIAIAGREHVCDGTPPGSTPTLFITKDKLSLEARNLLPAFRGRTNEL